MNSEKILFNKINSKKLNAKDQQLLSKVWQSKRIPHLKFDSVNSHFSELNALLSDKGWPLGITTEIGLSQPGIGEMRLLLPALKTLQQKPCSAGHIVWIAPPFTPLSSSLHKEGLDLSLLTIVDTKKIEDTIWAAEQVLLSNSCAAVFVWTGKHYLNNKILRRLQLAVEKSNCWSLILRHQDCLQQPSVSYLRLSLQTTVLGQLQVDILKQPHSWANQRCILSLSPHYERWQRLPANLLPHQNGNHNNGRVNYKLHSSKKPLLNRSTDITKHRQGLE